MYSSKEVIRLAKGNNGNQKETGLHLYNRWITAKLSYILEIYPWNWKQEKTFTDEHRGKELRESDSWIPDIRNTNCLAWWVIPDNLKSLLNFKKTTFYGL